MTTKEQAKLRALARRIVETFDPGGSLDPYLDEWFTPHADAIDELVALLDTLPPEDQ